MYFKFYNNFLKIFFFFNFLEKVICIFNLDLYDIIVVILNICFFIFDNCFLYLVG